MTSSILPAKKLPKHVAIIMDGNGRWAKKKGLSRLEGHQAGINSAKDIVRYCGELKIPNLTLFAFSSENWSRPKSEIENLMNLLKDYLNKDFKELVQKGVRVRTIGQLNNLPMTLQAAILNICAKTKECSKLNLTLALSYGSRSEIISAAKQIAQDMIKNKIKINNLDENLFASYLETRDLPDPDLLIRTSGEMRISNFLLWQLSYAELYFTKTLWPDFKPKNLDLALKEYSQRDRRFGRSSRL